MAGVMDRSQDRCAELEARIAALGDERLEIALCLCDEHVWGDERAALVARRRALDLEETRLWDALRVARAASLCGR